MTVSRVTRMRRSADFRAAAGCLIAVGALSCLPSSATADEKAAATRTTYYFSDSSTDRTPAKTSFPTYPRIARRDRIEGDATVCFKITLDGRIREVRVEDYSHRIFRRPSLKAIRSSTFEPLQPDETFSTSRTCRTYRFRLEPIVAGTKSEG